MSQEAAVIKVSIEMSLKKEDKTNFERPQKKKEKEKEQTININFFKLGVYYFSFVL